MNTSRRIRLNRRRWAEPSPVLRFKGRLSADVAEQIRGRWLETVRRGRGPVLVDDRLEVIR